VRHGEPLKLAAARELKEETDLSATIGEALETVEILDTPGAGVGGQHHVVVVFRGAAPRGTAVAGDDAEAVGWFSADELEGMTLAPETASLLLRMTQPAGPDL
jgi:ADP-ribose pyrophosphatase YjhB (NUDIX family)